MMPFGLKSKSREREIAKLDKLELNQIPSLVSSVRESTTSSGGEP